MSKKIKILPLLGGIFRKALNPFHLAKVMRLQKNRRTLVRSSEDLQLKLYSQILPGGFLHYGYFDDVDVSPLDLSLNDIYQAQQRYAQLIIEQISDKQSPILDVGCGMGGLVRLMLEQNLNPVALSPDKNQIRAIKSLYPEVSTIESRFETMPEGEIQNRYGTVITAESLNYLHLPDTLPLIERLLVENGRWIICDFFNNDATGETSGHWDYFQQNLQQAGFQISSQRDITPHILPTLAYVSMWGEKLGRPLFDFSIEKLRGKQPGIHYLFQDVLQAFSSNLNKHLKTVDPEDFARRKKYVLMVVERSPANSLDEQKQFPRLENSQALRELVATNGNAA